AADSGGARDWSARRRRGLRVRQHKLLASGLVRARTTAFRAPRARARSRRASNMPTISMSETGTACHGPGPGVRWLLGFLLFTGDFDGRNVIVPLLKWPLWDWLVHRS